jgi:hypothetical protein
VGFYHIPARRAWAKVAGGGTIGHSSSYAEATEDAEILHRGNGTQRRGGAKEKSAGLGREAGYDLGQVELDYRLELERIYSTKVES